MHHNYKVGQNNWKWGRYYKRGKIQSKSNICNYK